MRAILSVSDKGGLVEFARGLHQLGVEIFSTGGTKHALIEAGVSARSVSDLTGFPEILDGRVKTLHPMIHGGILARRELPQHVAQLKQHGIGAIDIVVVNLYPFAKTVAKPEATLEEALENIDIGGPTLIRAAAKNYTNVVVVVDPKDYEDVLDELGSTGDVSQGKRRVLAAKAFQHTAIYDTHVATYLRPPILTLPESMTVALEKVQGLRYGENPHQDAALYADSTIAIRSGTIVGARQLSGKELSFNNILDLDAAFNCARDFGSVAVAIVKHGNPCGLACGEELAETYQRAHEGDPVSAFGGVIGLNRVVDVATAELIYQNFYEDIIAPGYAAEALEILRRKKDLRVLQAEFVGREPAGAWPASQLDLKRISGGYLIQTPDVVAEDALSLKVVSEREPTLEELTDLVFAWRAVKHVKSNGIVLSKRLSLVGVGAGQMSRVDSVEIAVRKAGHRAVGCVLASDAFFPKADGVEAAASAGVSAIIQPGGSIRDDEVTRTINKHHLAMIFTGQRHFKH
ncbi:MAG: bifunctional phosphoribosylaminoimidazolecarboxamide formyltransferase/IMP cyclohydrolase [Chloroflexi bacterium]|nr:bifunctional phosphoribosylaminoimidazolecarboxamide formyltransferase/IMP cyclohydrolase [Chloroflexota bacterium]